MWKNSAQRVGYGAMRCYVTGEDGEQLLLYCPESIPPRTRVVTRGDPSLQQTGITESIFTPLRDIR